MFLAASSYAIAPPAIRPFRRQPRFLLFSSLRHDELFLREATPLPDIPFARLISASFHSAAITGCFLSAAERRFRPAFIDLLRQLATLALPTAAFHD